MPGDTAGAGHHVRVTGRRAEPGPGEGPRHGPQGGAAGGKPWTVSQELDAARHCGHVWVSQQSSDISHDLYSIQLLTS